MLTAHRSVMITALICLTAVIISAIAGLVYLAATNHATEALGVFVIAALGLVVNKLLGKNGATEGDGSS